MHRRPIDVGIAGSTIALVQDIGGTPTVMVSICGFSDAALNHLTAERIIELIDAEALRWIPVLEKRFAVDRAFKVLTGELVEALRTGRPTPFEDEALPYEEWLAAIYTGLSLFPRATTNILRFIAANHFDDGHRYNAIQILAEEGALSSSILSKLSVSETDPDVIELIQETQAALRN